MVRPINTIADPVQLKILKTPAVLVDDVSKYVAFIEDLVETSKNDSNCVGLAASQIWTDTNNPPPRIFTALVNNIWKVIINPTSQRHGKYFSFSEGCMSQPGYQTRTKRREIIEVTYMDLQGDFKTERFSGIAGIIIQHELDHLSGKLI